VSRLFLEVLLVGIVLGLVGAPAGAVESPVTGSASEEGTGQEPAEEGTEPTDLGEEPAERLEEEVAESEEPLSGEEEDRRDPFRPFLIRTAEVGGIGEYGPTAYEVQQLTLVGVMLDIEPPRALLQDTGGMGFVVIPGSRVGRRGGVVASIESGRMIVEEKKLDFYGREQVTRQVLEILSEDQAVGRE